VRLVLRLLAGALAAVLLIGLSTASARAEITPPTPIRHVVVIYQENHTFDDTLGTMCNTGRCDGVRKGKLPSGETIPLARAPDIVPGMDHSRTTQNTAINGGAMNGFANIPACAESKGYRCYMQYYPDQIPNLSALARRFAISDRTFSMDPIPSWGAHLELVAAQLDGFTGSLPVRTPATGDLIGWGCDSNRDAGWRARPGGPVRMVPSCVPDFSLDPVQYPYGGAYRPTPVKYAPTIMDRLNETHRSWRIYASKGPGIGSYGWAICPTFAECLYKQRRRMVDSQRIITDANHDRLPSLSLVMPEGSNSQHNFDSMAKGDNWIGNVVGAIQNSADWPHTAIFITYDDCGCFYDHVPPPVKNWGLRMPMVIVSPYAKPHYTDSHNATFVSMLTFTEHVFGLEPLTGRDGNGYDYGDSFNFNQPQLRTPKMTISHISKRERQYLEAHPADPNDPT
jgi:phospholipase C